VYLEETRIPEQNLKKLLKRDLYIDADKCIEWFVVDKIWK
jgi:hypothetical protein